MRMCLFKRGVVFLGAKHPSSRKLQGDRIMLVLGRRVGQSIVIGEDIEIMIVSTYRGYVRMGINAPKEITIIREELIPKQAPDNKLLVDLT